MESLAIDSSVGSATAALPSGPATAPSGGSVEVTSLPAAPSNTGNAGNDYRPVANSAALYLYTFLATLVLLLSVSAAIVIRSFVLRRRHRRLVEEAIRNGTWVPPPPIGGGGRAPRVDLSKKPVMWEAYLGSHEKEIAYVSGGSLHDEPRDWDAIKPVSAAYLAPAPSPDQVNPAKQIDDQPTPPGPTPTRMHSLRAGMSTGFRWLVGLPPRQHFDRSASGSQINLGRSVEGGANAQPVVEKVPSSGPDGGPPIVRVSVIITMPRPPKPRSSPTPRGSTSFSSIPPIPPVASSSTAATPVLSETLDHPLSPHHAQLQQSPYSYDEDEPLPVMEMGVAELVVVDQEAEARRVAAAMDTKEPLGRDSVSITVEV